MLQNADLLANIGFDTARLLSLSSDNVIVERTAGVASAGSPPASVRQAELYSIVHLFGEQILFRSSQLEAIF